MRDMLRHCGLKARMVADCHRRLDSTPLPVIAMRRDGSCVLLARAATERVLENFFHKTVFTNKFIRFVFAFYITNINIVSAKQIDCDAYCLDPACRFYIYVKDYIVPQITSSKYVIDNYKYAGESYDKDSTVYKKYKYQTNGYTIIVVIGNDGFVGIDEIIVSSSYLSKSFQSKELAKRYFGLKKISSKIVLIKCSFVRLYIFSKKSYITKYRIKIDGDFGTD